MTYIQAEIIDCSDVNIVAAHDCKCHGAVMRAYDSMIKADRPYVCALQVAKIIYAHHHPNVSKAHAALTVERWVNGDLLQ